ncbi:GNAT family N-acetyltransferase [Nereida sp. MMG025]|uniref:GNAT family N-acetyltransferase n=1 Tax=Nereida sp. MMG025 TaxID=2909981 RepID=UPI001F44DD43|nr:GNAT family protein [Nereida sp. MMG025]MCF6445384.1 GNAT family N-acetyltransferase [Nereida sp. MMG025]
MGHCVWPDPVTLTGTYVRLEPLAQRHCADLQQAAADLQGLWYTWVPSVDGMAAEIERRNALSDMRAFAVVDQQTGQAMGMTTYMNIDVDNARVEIGSTWLGKDIQRGPWNTQAKLLMLAHAFEVLGCIAVEFRTHRLNSQSRRAIERLGAQLDGILRNHMKTQGTGHRDTAVYSVIESEWPVVKTHLQWQLDKPRA